MTNLLDQELAQRGAITFDEADVLAAVQRKVTARRVRRQRTTVGAAGFVVVAVAVSAVAFGHRSPQASSPPLPGVVVSASPAVALAPDVLASSVTVIKERLADVAGVSVGSTDTGGVVARGPASARDRIVAAISAEGQLSVRPVLATNVDVQAPATLSTLPAQPTGSLREQQMWQESVIAAAKKGALPCRRTVAPVISTLPLVSCNPRDGSVAVLAPPIVSGPVKAEVVLNSGGAGWGLNVTFGAAGGRAFDTYTASHLNSQTAFTVDNLTLLAPAIQEFITSDTVAISGSFTESQVKEYAQELNHPLPGAFHVTDVNSTH